jgi:hypothetical protein
MAILSIVTDNMDFNVVWTCLPPSTLHNLLVQTERVKGSVFFLRMAMTLSSTSSAFVAGMCCKVHGVRLFQRIILFAQRFHDEVPCLVTPITEGAPQSLAGVHSHLPLGVFQHFPLVETVHLVLHLH